MCNDHKLDERLDVQALYRAACGQIATPDGTLVGQIRSYPVTVGTEGGNSVLIWGNVVLKREPLGRY